MARVVNYDHNFSFILLATVITIVNYDRKTFIVQATEDSEKKNVARFYILCVRLSLSLSYRLMFSK